MQWVPSTSKKIKFTEKAMLRQDTMRFKRRSDVLTMHKRYPGALAGHFLNQVRQRLGLSYAQGSDDLRQTDVSRWGATMSDFKDVRDVREAHLLGVILGELGKDRLSEAADIIAMRLRELKAAKRDGGSWEKAAVLSLLPGTHAASAPVTDGAFVL